MPDLDCQCSIVGAGPAGMVLALLLARKGIKVKLLEMHADLNRDFRGDTVHASTLEMLDQIGLAEGALNLPHGKMHELSIRIGSKTITPVNLSRLKTRFPYVAMMPQELFLNYLKEVAEQYDNFEMLFSSAVTGLQRDEQNQVTGIEVKQGSERIVIKSDLVVACDGRFSKLRRMVGLKATDESQPMDVAWLRLSRKESDEETYGGFYIRDGNICVLLNRPDNWQIGYIFPKGNFAEIRKQGIEQLRLGLRNTIPWMDERVKELKDFKQVHVLNVKADRLETWHCDGVLLIGDAAHVMSPAGGVGINFAIADAVEAANVLIEPLQSGTVSEADLAEVQNRRFKATKTIQRIQGLIVKNLIGRALGNKEFDLPLVAKILLRIPYLRDIAARMIAFGPKPARIENP